MACEYCDIIEGKKPAAKLYEDGKVICILSDEPSAAGHVLVIPKRHVQIFEMLSDSMVSHVMNIANKVSIALFESIKAQGTNIMTQNGVPAGQDVPHFCVHVIARRQGDGLIFDWLPRKLSEEEMGAVEMKLKEELSKKHSEEPASGLESETTSSPKQQVDQGRPETKPEENSPEKSEGKPEVKTEDKKPDSEDEKPEEESYLIRQLRRTP